MVMLSWFIFTARKLTLWLGPWNAMSQPVDFPDEVRNLHSRVSLIILRRRVST